MAQKNVRGKQVPYNKAKTHAYDIYKGRLFGMPATWYVLKMYQSPEKAASNPFARAFCLVVTPMTGESGDLGDVYLSDIGGERIGGTYDAMTNTVGEMKLNSGVVL